MAKKQATTSVSERYGHLATDDSFHFALHVATIAVLTAVMATMVTQTIGMFSADRGQVAGIQHTNVIYR